MEEAQTPQQPEKPKTTVFRITVDYEVETGKVNVAAPMANLPAKMATISALTSAIQAVIAFNPMSSLIKPNGQIPPNLKVQ